MALLPNHEDISSLTEESDFVEREANFGDGYDRLGTQGINNVKDRLNLQYASYDPDTANTLYVALKALREGTPEAVQYTPPDETVSRNWMIRRLRKRWDSPNTIKISLTLQEWFGG